MLRYRINSTYGEYSAGTEVEIVGAESHEDGVKIVTVAPLCGDPSDDFFDIPVELLTKCRNRTDMVPALNRRERRRGKGRTTNSDDAGGSSTQDALTSHSEGTSA